MQELLDTHTYKYFLRNFRVFHVIGFRDMWIEVMTIAEFEEFV